jgi:hypothetical protein
VTPDEIRRLYARERAATDAEAAETGDDARTDPVIARALWQTITAMSSTDPDFALLLSMTLGPLLVELIGERVQADDAWALKAAGALLDTMARTTPPPRTPRGKATRAKTA